MESSKVKFIELLKSTQRNGIDSVVKNLEKLGFFTAPASTIYHGNYEGGLLQHSLNVYEQLMYLQKVQVKIRPDFVVLDNNSCILTSLLHDVCKSNFYKMTKKWKKDDENNKWYQVDEYKQDYSYLPVGHGEKSVIMLLSWGLELTEIEICAIRWHMGAFDISTYPDQSKSFNEAYNKYPLVTLLSTADLLATRITEHTEQVKS